MKDFREVTKEIFFRTVGKLNVHPRVREETLKTSVFVSDWLLPTHARLGVSMSETNKPTRFFIYADIS